MDQHQGWACVDRQRAALADLLETLTDEEWATPSLCAGWSVREVGAHLSQAATTGTREALGHLVRARGSFDRMIHDSVVERARRDTGQIVADLRSVIGSRRLAPATFWRDPLLDVLVHGQDIARPLGREVPSEPDAARTAAEWAWQRGFPFFPSRRLRGVRLVAEDITWTRGRGEEIRGPIMALLLLSTGRSVGLDDTTGPGVEVARRRGGAMTDTASPDS